MMQESMGDVIIRWAKEYPHGGTNEGMKLLGLKNHPDNYAAGNLFVSALCIIARLLKEKGEIK